MKFATAQKRASEIMHKDSPVSGKKVSKPKRKVAGKAKPTAKKKVAGTKVTGTRKRKSHVKVASTRKGVKHVSGTLKKGAELEKKITALELKRKNSTLKEYRDLVQLEINKTHKELKALHRKI